MKPIKELVSERLMRYATINTASDPHSACFPTTERQRTLAALLSEELKALGVPQVIFDKEKCLVYAKIPSNVKNKSTKALGLIAHLDTSPEAPSEAVKPWILENYPGGDIVLNKEKNIIMRESEFANLKQYIGNDLILTDGTTLLGGDDKAAIAAIMTLAEYVCCHPDFLHGDICIAFTPDEEVGGLAGDLDLKLFGADAAYTVDCDHLGHYSVETFYAGEALISIKGRSVHPGTAKGIMINAAEIAAAFIAALPEQQKPQFTDGSEGFFYIISSCSTCEEGRIEMIIRDFDLKAYNEKKELIQTLCERFNRQYGSGRLHCEIHEQYRNMKEVVDNYPYLSNHLKKAIKAAGITPVCEPFRGGTDGAALSFRGLPCPNLSAGYENAHGKNEYVPIQSMEKNVEILKNLVSIYAQE